MLGADKTKLAHLVEVGQSLDLFVLLLKEHLYEEHLSLLLNQIPAIFSIFWSLNRHIETSVLGHVDLVSDVRIDCQSSWLNICLTELAKAAFPRGPIFLPNLKFLVSLSLLLLPGAFLILESKYTIVAWVSKWIWMLLKAEKRLSTLTTSIPTTLNVSSRAASIQTSTALTHFAHLNKILI